MRTAGHVPGLIGLIGLVIMAATLVTGCGKRAAVSARDEAGGRHEAPGLVQKSGVEDRLQDVFFLRAATSPAGSAAGENTGRIGFAVGSAGTILKTTDDGATWRRVFKRDVKSPDFEGVVFVTTNEGWVVSQNLLLHTADAGATWQSAVHLPGMFYYFGPYAAITGAYYQMQPPTCGAAVCRTTDGGRSWVSLPARLPHNDYKALCFVDDQHGWVVGDRDRLALTVDGGQTWQTATVPDSPYLEQVLFVNSQTGWIRPGYEHGGGILKTTDGGQTWRRQLAGLEPLWNILDLQFLDENTGFLLIRVAHDQWCVLRTQDGGATWQTIGRHKTELTAICFIDADHGWAVGAKGCIFHYTPL